MERRYNLLSVALILTVLHGGPHRLLGFDKREPTFLPPPDPDPLVRLSAKETSKEISRVVAAQGRLVAVGQTGTILTSTDGADWQEAHTGTSAFLHDVAFGQGRLVAVGINGTVLTSDDGVHWTSRSSKQFPCLYSVTHGQDRFVIVGSNGAILTSPDGQAWRRRDPGGSEHLHSVAYGNGLFVAVGEQGRILTSSNGEECGPLEWRAPQWTTRPTLDRVASDGGHCRVMDSRNRMFRIHPLGHSGQTDPTGPVSR